MLTVSDILRGQGEALNVDRRDLHADLYDCLLLLGRRELVEGGGREDRDTRDAGKGRGGS